MTRSTWKPFLIDKFILRHIEHRLAASNHLRRTKSHQLAQLLSPRHPLQPVKPSRLVRFKPLGRRTLLKRIRDSVIPLGFAGRLRIYRGTIWNIKYQKHTVPVDVHRQRIFVGRRCGEFSFTKRYGRQTHRFNKSSVKSLNRKKKLIMVSQARQNKKKLSTKEQGRLKAKFKAKKTAKKKALKKLGK